MASSDGSTWRLAVVGAGPVGLALALHAAANWPTCDITVFDAREHDAPVAADPRTLALSLGSVRFLEQLGAWPPGPFQPISGVHVSQQGSWLEGLSVNGPSALGRSEVLLQASEQGVDMLGAVLAYGILVAHLQQRWLDRAQADASRLHSRFGARVQDVKPLSGRAEVDTGIAEAFDLVVVAEGGVFSGQPVQRFPRGINHDYHQTAWVGTVTLAQPHQGLAYERFTREGPAALLPLTGEGDTPNRAALVWCVDSSRDPVAALSSEQRLAVLNTVFPAQAGALTALSELKAFPLGLNAYTQLVHGRIVRVGNAAQTLHPVAGQGLNLGLRDVAELVEAVRSRPGELDRALSRMERRRAPDRWSMIAATDFLARSFTWSVPGLGTARAIGLGALQRLGPVKRLLAQRMMNGGR